MFVAAPLRFIWRLARIAFLSTSSRRSSAMQAVCVGRSIKQSDVCAFIALRNKKRM
jgi:hypothetical protein